MQVPKPVMAMAICGALVAMLALMTWVTNKTAPDVMPLYHSKERWDCLNWCGDNYGHCEPVHITGAECGCSAGCNCEEPPSDCASFCVRSNALSKWYYLQSQTQTTIYSRSLDTYSSGVSSSSSFSTDLAFGKVLVTDEQVAACLAGCVQRAACTGVKGPASAPPAP